MILQQLKSSSVKEDKPDINGGNTKPLHPEHQTALSSFKFATEDGSWIMDELFGQIICKDFNFPTFSGKLSSLNQPVKSKVLSATRCSNEDGNSLIAICTREYNKATLYSWSKDLFSQDLGCPRGLELISSSS